MALAATYIRTSFLCLCWLALGYSVESFQHGYASFAAVGKQCFHEMLPPLGFQPAAQHTTYLISAEVIIDNQRSTNISPQALKFYSQAMTAYIHAIDTYSAAVTSYMTALKSYSQAINIYIKAMTGYIHAINIYTAAVTSYMTTKKSYSKAIDIYIKTITAYIHTIDTCTPAITSHNPAMMFVGQEIVSVGQEMKSVD